jgi:hypothetical protein
MAKVKLSSALTRVSSRLGNVVFRRYGDEIILAQRPDLAGRAPTPGQAAHRQRFRLAALYGRTVLADPEKKALYEARARARGLPVFALTIADFLHVPAVDQIDLSGYTGRAGETIRIRASDDIEVAGVEVGITDAGGAVLERGAAAARDGVWEYATTRSCRPAGRC